MQKRQTKSKGRFFIKRKKALPPVAPANEKGSFPDYMRKEIFSQPVLINQLIDKYVRADKIDFDYLKIKIDKIKRIYIVGSSKNYSCVLAGAYNFEVLADIPAIPMLMSEFIFSNPILDKNTLVIAVGGDTEEYRAVMSRTEKSGARLISILDFDNDSTFAVSLDFDEKGAVSTAGYTLRYTALSLLALYFGEKNQVVTELYIKIATRMLRSLSDKIKSVLENEYFIKHMVQKTDKNSLLCTGTNVDFASALYGAYLFSFAYGRDITAVPVSEIKELKDRYDVIAFASNESFYEVLTKTLDSCKKIIPENINSGSENTIAYDDTIPLLNPILAAAATQLMAYNIAKERGIELEI